MKFKFLLLLLFLCTALAPRAKTAAWEVSLDRHTHAFTIRQGRQAMLTASVPEARFGPELVSAADLPEVMTRKTGLEHPVFGKGTLLVFQFTDGRRILTQHFSVFPTAVITGLTLSMADGSPVESNYLAPIRDATPGAFPVPGNSRGVKRPLEPGAPVFLKVPFDNDDFVRYHLLPLDTAATSYEVAALLCPATRRGLVIGSIDHDRWKSAISLDHARLAAFSGVSTRETRDLLPHGSLCGKTVSSARFLIAARTDWRDAMEQFARACNSVQPGRKSWPHGTPFGWQSWGVLATKNSFETDLDVSDFMAQTLRPAGYCSADGTQVLSIDAWDNLSPQQKRALCDHAKANGQVPGTYVTPFCLWWNDGDLDRPLFDGCPYTGRDACLKVGGQPHKYDGAFCLDPTHPATLERFAREAAELKAAGFEYFKIDFTTCGMVQADSYFIPDVRTAVEAYNYGFTRFLRELDRGRPVFTALSIAPIFPYHYGNSRRIACDTWGRIDQTEYAMNAICYGWWTSEFYQFNDPDHLVLVGKEAAHGHVETEGENRARYTTGVCSGMVLLPDVWSLNDRSGHGDARLSIQRARHIAMNPEVNAVARLGRTFRPLYGGHQWRPQTGAAENLITLRTDTALYLAAINFSDLPLQLTVPLADLGLSPGQIAGARELWTGTVPALHTSHLTLSLPAEDARLLRLTLK